MFNEIYDYVSYVISALGLERSFGDYCSYWVLFMR